MRNTTEPIERAQWVRALAAKPTEFDPQSLYGGMRESTSASCLLTSTNMRCHVHINTYIHIHK